MSTPGVLPPLSSLRIKNCLEDQGLAISSMLATPGEASVACGSRVLGSGAGVGTSICGWSATRGSVCLGWSAQRAPRKTTTSTRRSPIPSLREESRGGDGAPSEDTPGICGMSALKRSDGGRSGIKAPPCLYTGNPDDIQSAKSPNADKVGEERPEPTARTPPASDQTPRSLKHLCPGAGY